MFVGQAPGAQEDVSGKCFVGPAGQLLRQAIKQYLPDVATRLTNAVKCMPPDDRDPNKTELAACRPFLDNEIKQHAPKILVAVGNIALKALTGKAGITTYAGRLVPGTNVFPILHPSYILRYPRNQPKFEADFRALAELVNPGSTPAAPRIQVNQMNPTGLAAQLGKWAGQVVSFDFETNGRALRDGGFLRCASFSTGEDAVWIDVEKWGGAAMEVIGDFLREDIEKCAHNLGFETNWAHDLFAKEPKKLKWDTMVLHYLWNENSLHNLESVAMEVCQAPAWDIDHLMKQNGWTWETVPMSVLGPYNALDSYWTARVRPVLWEKLRPVLRDLYTKIVLPQAKVCARLERRGVKIDAEWAGKVAEATKAAADKLYHQITHMTPVVEFECELESEGKKLNLNSDKQLARLLYKKLKLPVVEETDGGAPSVRAAALERIKKKHPIVPLYLDWSSHITTLDRYLNKIPTFRDQQGIAHARFNPARIVTGRIAVTDPPLQTLPTSSSVRGMIVSRFDGGKIVTADYSQLEIRIVASEANEVGLIKALIAGEDPHTRTAMLIFADEFHGKDHCDRCTELRSIAKRINFGVVYGISPHNLAAEFNLPEERAERIFRQYWKSHPAVNKWMRCQHVHLREKGFVRTMFGRRRRLPEIKLADKYQAARMERQVGNFPVQGGGADLTNIAMAKVDKWLRKSKMESLLVLQIHDSLMIDTHPKEVDIVRSRIVDIMCREVQEDCPRLLVPLKADVKVEHRWGGATEVKVG